jgi:hypothetical protein
MNIGYLGFDGPSEQSQSVSRAKTAKTLICTFGSKMGLFGGFEGIFRRGSYPFPSSQAKPKFIGLVSKQTI